MRFFPEKLIIFLYALPLVFQNENKKVPIPNYCNSHYDGICMNTLQANGILGHKILKVLHKLRMAFVFLPPSFFLWGCGLDAFFWWHFIIANTVAETVTWTSQYMRHNTRRIDGRLKLFLGKKFGLYDHGLVFARIRLNIKSILWML